ncbi:hypothetical protein ACNPNM_09325 [Klebsiella variicola]|uniref:hypothetical protein n=1 Tax=Klebsiella pneumoniae complex TaxID=3390273 RepID=UPI0015DC2381|nr:MULTISPECIES: hypothetical protein [Klebsiella]HBR1893706.1 hypothetical protein [Klebsiella quasipneumoniae subsp. similipneumoniae]HCI5944413.1 hypothetical protein [Klebsiella quasipneumoniae subsp. quasipneumoniae]MCS5871035.1 hypothetical protein [Klebsiella variicola subsp. variicola]BBS20065.1 hypothetical protein WP5W18E06_06020 [Klebsiella quasipneumoniae]HBX8040693.1 hypothetical protein [Klebsiella pneumoniae]
MPKASVLFKDMKKRVDRLKGKYMSRQLRNEAEDPIGYNFDALNIAAYRLLVHAEIEEYIEAKASEKLSEIKSNVAANGFNTSYYKNILAIACLVGEPVSVTTPYDEGEFKQVVFKIISAAEEKVKKNNGIKKGSFILLASFCGCAESSIDPILLTNLESYGKRRGSVAHRGARHANNISAPSSEVSDAESIMNLLRFHFYGF